MYVCSESKIYIMETNNETHLRVITPDTFANIDSIHGDTKEDYSGLILTKEHAENSIKEFGNVPVTSEHYEYWKEQRAKCTIVRVTTIIEENIESKLNYEAAPEMLKTLSTLNRMIKISDVRGEKFNLSSEPGLIKEIQQIIKKATS